MGDKIRSKNHVTGYGVPVVPGIAEPGMTDAQLIEAAASVGFPLLIKPSAGGGGKGMHIVERPEDLSDALADRPAGRGLRLRRRHPLPGAARPDPAPHRGPGPRGRPRQRHPPGRARVLAAAPAPEGHRGGAVAAAGPPDAAIRARIGEAACEAARWVDYTGAGTVEFLVSDDAPDEFFFMEMNTRLQVEHPVTEMVTGVDLVEWQVRIAAGEALPSGQADVVLTGHAVEARVYAEDPAKEFLPSAGRCGRTAGRSPTGEPASPRWTRLAGRPGDPLRLRPDDVQGHRVGRGPARALARLDGALAETACWASTRTSSTCACWPTTTCTPAGSTPP